jgi:SSS family solute:Na+ symporter
MNWLDWTIIILYLTGMISLSVCLGRSQSSLEDYFVGGRKLSWWSVGISTMATQTSAISFISIPAFVALKTGGGLTWLQYELGVPLAMIIVMAFLIPFFRRRGYHRFDRRCRLQPFPVDILSRFALDVVERFRGYDCYPGLNSSECGKAGRTNKKH